MLHALEKNKTTYYRRYLGYRDGHEKRVCEEDEITSTVFGPLEFIEAASVFQFWSEVFRLQGQSAALPVQAPVRYKFKLWPRHEVEPDAHLTFFSAENKRFDILIEVKWHAPLSGENQLRLQWLNYLDEDVRQNCWHVFIAPEISAGLKARGDSEKNNVWKIGNDERLILVSWAQIRDALSKCQGRPDGLARWAVLTSHFLEQIGIKRFNGFEKARIDLPVSEILHHWSFRGLTHGFAGFKVAATGLQKSECIFKPFFKE